MPHVITEKRKNEKSVGRHQPTHRTRRMRKFQVRHPTNAHPKPTTTQHKEKVSDATIHASVTIEDNTHNTHTQHK